MYSIKLDYVIAKDYTRCSCCSLVL